MKEWRTRSTEGWRQRDFAKCQSALLKEIHQLKRQVESFQEPADSQTDPNLLEHAQKPSETKGPNEADDRSSKALLNSKDPDGRAGIGLERRVDCDPSSWYAWTKRERGQLAQAIDLLCQIANDGCERAKGEVEDAQRYVDKQRHELEAALDDDERFSEWNQNVIDALSRCYPALTKPVSLARARLAATSASSTLAAPKQSEPKRKAERDASPVTTTNADSTLNLKISQPATQYNPPKPPAGRRPEVLTFDVWQSAWADFADFADFAEYAARNNITEVNLNIGMPVNPDWEERVLRRLTKLSQQLRSGGVRRINLMYAERFHPIGEFAAFLSRHPELRIDTIVDDSEFVDAARHRFNENLEAVSSHSIRYGAFVTLEGKGNSGVSDDTRYWVLENVEEPILMSYFACSVEGQEESAGRFLRYADENVRERSRFVKVALLLGGKSVGREFSCEKKLEEWEFQRLLQDVHAAFLEYRSYGGLVLETNRRLPRYDIARRPLIPFPEFGAGEATSGEETTGQRLHGAN